jgi:hypothetical protein
VNNSDELALSVILEALDSSDKNAKISAIRAISGATMNQVKTATVRNLHEEVQRVIKSEDFDLALYVAALPILIQYDKENVIRKCKQLLKGGEKITGPLIHTFHSSRGVVAAHILFLLKDWLPHENNPLSMIGIIHAIKDFISKEILLEVISHGLTHDSPYVRLSFTKTMRYLEKDEMTTLIESNIHQEPDEYLKSVMKSYL